MLVGQREITIFVMSSLHNLMNCKSASQTVTHGTPCPETHSTASTHRDPTRRKVIVNAETVFFCSRVLLADAAPRLKKFQPSRRGFRSEYRTGRCIPAFADMPTRFPVDG